MDPRASRQDTPWLKLLTPWQGHQTIFKAQGARCRWLVWLRAGPKRHGQDSRQGGLASISHGPPAGVGRVLGWWQKAWVSCSCPTYGFEELQWFSVQGTWHLCLFQSLAAGRHEAKAKWAPWIRKIGSYKTRILPFPFSKSHCPARGGWTSPSLPQRFTMYPMAWSHRRDTRCRTLQMLRHWGAHNIPIPWAAQFSPAQGWDN